MDVLSLDQEVGAWDSVLLDPLTEDSFIANLHQRFKRDHIYVSILNIFWFQKLNTRWLLFTLQTFRLQEQ